VGSIADRHADTQNLPFICQIFENMFFDRFLRL
jgi:hypothetical protein